MKQHYEKSEVRRKQIASAAMEIIAEQGLDKFRGRLVAERIGITDGTVFRHFKDKTAIVEAVLDLLEEEFESVESSLADLDPEEGLRKLFLHRANLLAGPKAVGRLLFSDQLYSIAGEQGRKRVFSWQVKTFAFIAQRIALLQEKGRIREDLPPAILARTYVGFLITFSQSALRPTVNNLEEMILETWQHICVLLGFQEKKK